MTPSLTSLSWSRWDCQHTPTCPPLPGTGRLGRGPKNSSPPRPPWCARARHSQWSSPSGMEIFEIGISLFLIRWNRRNTWTSMKDHDRTWWWCPEDGQETFAQYLRKCSITFIYYSLPVWPGQVVMWRQRLIRLVTFLHTNEPGLVFSEKFILVFITTSMK